MPTQPVLKRLFAESGNQCALPGCSTDLVHPDTGAIVGEICHIRARRPGGPRFEVKQTTEERESYENLILLCSNHHKIVDDDPETYTVNRLLTMKQEHLDGGYPAFEVSEALLQALVAKERTVSGSVIATINQSGGQVAHTINNYGPRARQLSEETRNKVLGVLRRAEPSSVGFASTQGDLEAHQFKSQLMELFTEAGWDVADLSTFMFFGAHLGLTVTIPFKADTRGAPSLVAEALGLTGDLVRTNRGDMANDCGIYVQVWSAAQ